MCNTMSSQGDYRQAPVFLLTLVDIVMGGGGGLLIGITAQEGVWYFEKSFGVGCYKSA
jgi:hypothetical protein